jgi:hypothetical protein
MASKVYVDHLLIKDIIELFYQKQYHYHVVDGVELSPTKIKGRKCKSIKSLVDIPLDLEVDASDRTYLEAIVRRHYYA